MSQSGMINVRHELTQDCQCEKTADTHFKLSSFTDATAILAKLHHYCASIGFVLLLMTLIRGLGPEPAILRNALQERHRPTTRVTEKMVSNLMTKNELVGERRDRHGVAFKVTVRSDDILMSEANLALSIPPRLRDGELRCVLLNEGPQSLDFRGGVIILVALGDQADELVVKDGVLKANI